MREAKISYERGKVLFPTRNCLNWTPNQVAKRNELMKNSRGKSPRRGCVSEAMQEACWEAAIEKDGVHMWGESLPKNYIKYFRWS